MSSPSLRKAEQQEPAPEHMSKQEKMERARKWYETRAERRPRQKWMNGRWVKMLR